MIYLILKQLNLFIYFIIKINTLINVIFLNYFIFKNKYYKYDEEIYQVEYLKSKKLLCKKNNLILS